MQKEWNSPTEMRGEKTNEKKNDWWKERKKERKKERRRKNTITGQKSEWMKKMDAKRMV